jgi:flagellar basal-body rod protein FlgG
VDGKLVVNDANQTVSFPKGVKDIQFKPDGTVMADGQDVGKLAIRNVKDPAQLLREGTTTYSITPGAELVEPQGTELVQGHLEASNINAFDAVDELITIQRSFDALQRVIDAFQQIDQRTARDIGSRGG